MADPKDEKHSTSQDVQSKDDKELTQEEMEKVSGGEIHSWNPDGTTVGGSEFQNND